MDDKKQVRSWIMYDWANSAFATTIMAAVLPIYYKSVAAKDLGNLATSYWGYTTTRAMLIIAVLSPILGAIADYKGNKKSFLKFFVLLGSLATAMLFLVKEGNYLLASFLFILGSIGFSGGNVFYDSFLPEITTNKRMDYVSSLGYALGYLGGGLLLAVNLVMIMKPEMLGIADSGMGTRLSFVTVGIWWMVFSVPAFIHLPNGKRKVERDIKAGEATRMAFKELKTTFMNIREYKELWKFLLAFWLYNDGIGTIMRMATIYGTEIGIGSTDLIGALLMTQFIGIPFAILFGKIGQKIGTKKGIYIGLAMYLVIIIYGYYMDSAIDFWILAGMVGTVQGGAQALSRSLYGSMVPKEKSAEFFGFFGVSSKFAAITGPFVFALMGQLTGSSRYGIISVALFFILGMLLLSRVDEAEGRFQAMEKGA